VSNDITTTPPEAWEPLLRLARLWTRPLERFLQIQAASGIVLLVTAAFALAWANSPWGESYVQFWHAPIALSVGTFHFEQSLEWIVNDGLMVIFFFVVGLEIRREIAHGELSQLKRAVLPIGAALGGMVAPALIYLVIAGAPATRSGWGVPTATDIAFAVGVLTLLGKRVPPALRVLLLALAVIDDLGAIVVIGLFYSSGIHALGLVIAFGGLAWIFVMQWFGVRSRVAYVAPGFLIWVGVADSGIHPTIAGVVIGLVTPVEAWLGPGGFLVSMQQQLKALTATPHDGHQFAERLRHLTLVQREAQSPAEGLLETLHPWVAFGIMPLFALANAGVQLGTFAPSADGTHVSLAVAAGLVLGKPLGVLAACFVLLKLDLAALPTGLTWRYLLVLGAVAGIGFTMALFVAQLAFHDAALLAAAKVGILGATVAASVIGLVLGRSVMPPQLEQGAAKTADEAEASTEH
jgi:NhaA family Na+:H+ antiporter